MRKRPTITRAQLAGAIGKAVLGLLHGVPPDEIAQEVRASGCDPQTVLLEAYEMIQRRAETKDRTLAMHLESRRELFRQAVEKGSAASLAVALHTLQDAAKLEGLYDADAEGDEDDDDESPWLNVPSSDDMDLPVC
jgi:hypothetical protein